MDWKKYKNVYAQFYITESLYFNMDNKCNKIFSNTNIFTDLETCDVRVYPDSGRNM
jgi:hypothetical protein